MSALPALKPAPSLVVIEGGKVKLHPHPGQAQVLQSKKRFTFALAGSQAGKTSLGPWWLFNEIMARGPGDYLAVTATYDLFNLKMLPELLNVFEHILKIGRLWAGDGLIELADPKTRKFWANKSKDPMWGRIILRSAASGGGLESATALGAWLDECGQDTFSVDTWDAVQRRLSLAQGRVFGGTTPYNLGWLKTEIFDKVGKDPDIAVIQFPSIANPIFPKEEFERRRASMPVWKFNMFYRGLFERPAGLIYNDFLDDYRENGGHKVRPFEMSKDWPRYVGVDPGAVNTAMIWLAHDTDNDVYYLYRESLEGGKSTGQHAAGSALKAHIRGERVAMWFVGQKAEVQQRLDWKAAGVENVREPKIHDVEGGIDRVIRLFKQRRLFIFDDCRGLLDELGRYARELDASGEPTEKIKDKATFHRLDALRYAAVGVTSPMGVILY